MQPSSHCSGSCHQYLSCSACARDDNGITADTACAWPPRSPQAMQRAPSIDLLRAESRSLREERDRGQQKTDKENHGEQAPGHAATLPYRGSLGIPEARLVRVDMETRRDLETAAEVKARKLRREGARYRHRPARRNPSYARCWARARQRLPAVERY